MVQANYFGDDRDFFKYDLITALLKGSLFTSYVFIPMLTEPRDDGQGVKRKLPDRGAAADPLRNFIASLCAKIESKIEKPSLKHWKTWLDRHIGSYQTIEPVDQVYFTNDKRKEYWKRFDHLLKTEKALIFLDPDTGIQLGLKKAPKEEDKIKYILDAELTDRIDNLHISSVLMLYQHLQWNANMHEADVVKKLGLLNGLGAGVCTCAYREGDLAFLFISKDQDVSAAILKVLREYHAASANPYSAFHNGHEGIIRKPHAQTHFKF